MADEREKCSRYVIFSPSIESYPNISLTFDVELSDIMDMETTFSFVYMYLERDERRH